MIEPTFTHRYAATKKTKFGFYKINRLISVYTDITREQLIEVVNNLDGVAASFDSNHNVGKVLVWERVTYHKSQARLLKRG